MTWIIYQIKSDEIKVHTTQNHAYGIVLVKGI